MQDFTDEQWQEHAKADVDRLVKMINKNDSAGMPGLTAMVFYDETAPTVISVFRSKGFTVDVIKYTKGVDGPSEYTLLITWPIHNG